MRIGIVGSGLIVSEALQAFSEAGVEVKALWCRDIAKGEALKERYQTGTLYDDYEAFLNDESFDTVYIALINSLHFSYGRKALAAGKNAVIEKPFTLTADQAYELINLADQKGVFLFEAIMSRYSPNYGKIARVLKDIGEVKLVLCNYAQYSRRYDAYMRKEVLPAFDPKAGGGALYDINVYCLHFVIGLFGRPLNCRYIAVKGFNGIDTSGVMTLEYEGFPAVCCGAKDSSSACFALIQGTKGRIVVPHRPGIIKDVTLYKGEEEHRIDGDDDENPMVVEFKEMARVIDLNDRQKGADWLKTTLEVVKVMEKGRCDAGIVFSET